MLGNNQYFPVLANPYSIFCAKKGTRLDGKPSCLPGSLSLCIGVKENNPQCKNKHTFSLLLLPQLLPTLTVPNLYCRLQ